MTTIPVPAVPVPALVMTLRAATPDFHPFVGFPKGEQQGAAFIKISNAVADLVEASVEINGDTNFAAGVLRATSDLVTASTPEEAPGQ